MELEKQRQRIDWIDRRIVGLLSERMRAAADAGRLKKGKGLKITDRQRENEVIKRVRSAAKDEGLDEGFAESIFSIIIKQSRTEQR